MTTQDHRPAAVAGYPRPGNEKGPQEKRAITKARSGSDYREDYTTLQHLQTRMAELDRLPLVGGVS